MNLVVVVFVVCFQQQYVDVGIFGQVVCEYVVCGVCVDDYVVEFVFECVLSIYGVFFFVCCVLCGVMLCVCLVQCVVLCVVFKVVCCDLMKCIFVCGC